MSDLLGTAKIVMIVRTLAMAILLGLPGCSAMPEVGMPAPEPGLSSNAQQRLRDKRALQALLYLLRHQLPDGSWGGRPAGCECPADDTQSAEGDLETTACVLFSFVGYGYTVRSVDEYPEGFIGPALRRGLDWLLARQTPDGAFDETEAFRNALAALALAEMHGITLCDPEPTRRAAQYIGRHPAPDVRGRIWQGLVLHTATLDELGDYTKSLESISQSMAGKQELLGDAGHILVRSLAHNRDPVEGEEGRIEGLYRSTVDKTLPSDLYIAIKALFWGDPTYLRFHAWYKTLTSRLLILQQGGQDCRRGSLNGKTFKERIRHTAWFSMHLCHIGCGICGTKGMGTGRPR